MHTLPQKGGKVPREMKSRGVTKAIKFSKPAHKVFGTNSLGLKVQFPKDQTEKKNGPRPMRLPKASQKGGTLGRSRSTKGQGRRAVYTKLKWTLKSQKSKQKEKRSEKAKKGEDNRKQEAEAAWAEPWSVSKYGETNQRARITKGKKKGNSPDQWGWKKGNKEKNVSEGASRNKPARTMASGQERTRTDAKK